MSSLHFLRPLPLLRNGLLSHPFHRRVSACGIFSHCRRLWCSLAEQPPRPDAGDDSAPEKISAPVTDTASLGYARFEDPFYRKWKDVEAEILRDIDPITFLVKEILHSERYEDGERLTYDNENFVVEKLLAFHPHSEDKIGCGLDFIMVDRHPQFRHSRCLFVVRTDGGWIDFSYQKCLRAYVRDKYPSHAERFIREHLKRRSN
ncbi:PREDICTED: protein DCL, chloroplastic-like [Tarenaya hassleriana]|uniref:protein DCL, chloroplastic-like n=1 Tax=Tarenaya hassleriana TaxID=28532 RepID=UPI00053C6CE0|nr:PREDICTED: protein DCL, chloroplastic-like [Tarenaya hassleriana]